MTADVRMAEVAALVGDPARANILAALMGGRALTAGELVYAAGVSPQTTSGHLGKLTEGRLIACVKQGRHRYYRIATPRVAEMLEGIMAVVADSPPRHRPPSKLDDAMRTARTCYDHFAGKLGVGLTDALCMRGHLALADDGGEVTDNRSCRGASSRGMAGRRSGGGCAPRQDRCRNPGRMRRRCQSPRRRHRRVRGGRACTTHR